MIILRSTYVPTSAERLADWRYRFALLGPQFFNNYFKFNGSGMRRLMRSCSSNERMVNKLGCKKRR